jgi:2,4-dienoyl-CoA reductase (NADPH2)
VREALSGEARPAGRVVVVDETGFHEATSVSEMLADRGCAVTVMTPGMVVGQDLSVTLDLEGFNLRAVEKKIAQLSDRVVMGAGEHGLEVLHHPTGATEWTQADWVVLAVPPLPEDSLYAELVARRPSSTVARAGDCLAPRRAHAAVLDGERAGALVLSARGAPA